MSLPTGQFRRPPGNETLVVDYLKRVFESEGISVKTFALDSARANLHLRPDQARRGIAGVILMELYANQHVRR